MNIGVNLRKKEITREKIKGETMGKNKTDTIFTKDISEEVRSLEAQCSQDTS